MYSYVCLIACALFVGEHNGLTHVSGVTHSNFMHFDSAVKVYTCHSSGQKLAWAGYHASGAPKCALCNIGFAISHDDTQCILTCVGLKVWLANAVVYQCKCLFHLIHAPILPNRVLEVLDYDESINGRFQSKYQIILATIVVLSDRNNECLC